MADSCSRRSPLSRSGLTQAGRRRAELGPEHFRIDERDVADMILFARRYAKHIRYFEPRSPGAPTPKDDTDWSKFFDSDVSANLAALAKLPVESMVAFQSDLETWLKADPDRDPVLLGAYFKLFFHLPLALLQNAGVIAEKLPHNEALRTQIGELARRELAQPLQALIGMYKGAAEPGPFQLFADEGVPSGDYKLGPAVSDGRLRLPSVVQDAVLGRKMPKNEPLSPILVGEIPPGDWLALWKQVKADDAPYRDGGALAYERIYDALEYNLLQSAIRATYRAAARLKREAQARLQHSLEQFGGHEPHYGLWLAFLRLFGHAQQSLNGFTERHLDYYFRDILQLSGRSPVPDQVHLLFELAKSAEAVRIPAGTEFRAGNDAFGRPVSYALEQELIVNRGRVASLHGIRLDPGSGGLVACASRDLRSLDGLGEEPLPPERPAWPAFGPMKAPKARVGFAIADRKLFLREGARTINLTAEFARRLQVIPASDAWRVRLTGPEGWWEPAPGALSVVLDEATATGASEGEKGRRARPKLYFSLVLGADAPSIVPYDPTLHGGEGGDDGLPKMEILFDFERSSAATAFDWLRGVRLRRLELDVRATGIKQLSVIAGGATVDPAKPFAAFGPHPRADAALIIGSSEIFSKSLAAMTLTLEWQEQYESGKFFQSKADYQVVDAVLKAGRWVSGYGSHSLFASGKTVTINLRSADLADGRVAQSLENLPLTTASVAGFVRLSLSDDFGHADHPAALARALASLAKGEDEETLDERKVVAQVAKVVEREEKGERPEWTELAERRRHWDHRYINTQPRMPLPPYDPMVTRIEAEYVSRTDPVEQFAHLLPFGEVRAKPEAGELFPSFAFAGALLVGIADFAPPARLSLLFQVADGSGDPLKRPPSLRFEYLAGDSWKPFEDRGVDDKTGNLTGSGLIGFAVPADADRRHRAMPNGLHWIRISVAADADALNRLLSIDAQAGRAKFADAGNDPQFLATPLPANIISKFVRPDPLVKKIRQPYSSFGGRPAEAAGDFATRVSEQLRHKDRAVAVFDYEALILEAFPKLYRAKCLPTTAMVRDDSRRIIADNEVSPGAVTVVTVPWTHDINSRDPLRPFADQALLTAVEAFLKARVSPFVRLEVQNPKFEEVQAAFKVRFHAGVADIAFHREELNAALVEFLTPWSRPGGGDIMFGGKLWKSSLIDFVEERPEVDYVTDFQLYHKPDADVGEGRWTPVDVELIEATTARSILVSAGRHLIDEVGSNA